MLPILRLTLRRKCTPDSGKNEVTIETIELWHRNSGEMFTPDTPHHVPTQRRASIREKLNEHSPQSSGHGRRLTRRSLRSKSILAGIFALACAASQVPAVSANGQADQVPPIVDTQSWLRTVTQPPAAWKKVLEGRDDVLRYRFVRFQQPHSNFTALQFCCPSVS